MKIKTIAILATCLMACTSGLCAELQLQPTDAPSLSVRCTGGQVELPSGRTVQAQATTLSFAPPKLVEGEAEVKAPRDYDTWFAPYQPWPKRGKDGLSSAVGFLPGRDDKGVPILAGLYGALVPESAKVTSADGSKTFVRDEDYRLNANWGQIANISGRLGAHNEAQLKVSFTYALQRIDLVQVGPRGEVKVKPGESVLVCPMIPDADAGWTAVAGVYIAPWKQGGQWVVADEQILPIRPAKPVEPINPEAVSGTLAKLRAGQPVTIAIMGDSVTLGAEACFWWDNQFTAKDITYRGLFVQTLRERFPAARITPVPAFKGGTTTEYGVKVLRDEVLPTKPDLVTIAFGLNDATSAIGSPSRVPAEKFREYITDMVRAVKAAGGEVVLITPMQPSPFQENKIAEHIEAHVQVLREIGRDEKVAVADVFTAWMAMADRGIPPYSQLHNWVNHPGAYGHTIYADTLLRLFPAKSGN